MRIAVLGGLGFIGSHLVDAFKARGNSVVVFDNGSQATVEARASKADYAVVADVRNLAGYERIHFEGFDWVIHAASPAGPARIAPGYALRPIIDATAEGLRFAQASGARFIKFSTSEVYGRADIRLDESAPCIVPSRYDARSEYAIGYLAAECLCANHPLPNVSVLRLFNVVGPRQRPEAGVVLPRFCQQARAGVPLTVYGDGSQRRAFLYVGDLVRLVLTMTEHPLDGKHLWNVADPLNETSILNLAKLVIETHGDGTLVLGGQPSYRESAEKCNVSIYAVTEQWGWRPATTLKEIVKRCLESTVA